MSRLPLARFLAPVAPQLGAVEAELQTWLRRDLAVVRRLADHVAKGQGKRLRPALLLMCSRMCGYEGEQDIRFGAVFEMTHTATLVHDDVIDHAATRRGEPTLNRVWGNTLSVLFGDLLYIQALASALQGRSWRLMEILAEVTTRMIEGELLQHDSLFKTGTTRADYFEILERKTALLFGGCTESAGVLAGRPEEDCQALRRYGLEIGRAFQLVDDLLDLTASSEALGKPAFSDLREGKLTLPMLTLLEQEPAELLPLLDRIWKGGEPLEPEGEARLRSLLEDRNAFAEIRQEARRASLEAVRALEGVQGRPEFKDLLLEIPQVLLERTI